MTANINKLHEHICTIGDYIQEQEFLKSAQDGNLKDVISNHLKYLKYKNETRINWSRIKNQKKLENILAQKKCQIKDKNNEELMKLQEILERGTSYFVFYTIQKYDLILNEVIKDALINE